MKGTGKAARKTIRHVIPVWREVAPGTHTVMLPQIQAMEKVHHMDTRQRCGDAVT